MCGEDDRYDACPSALTIHIRNMAPATDVARFARMDSQPRPECTDICCHWNK